MNSRAVIYARISDRDPKVEAIADQEKRCRALAIAEGYDVVSVLSDDGISAYSGKTRPGWLALNDGIRKGSFDVILAVAEDRLARSSEDKIGLQAACVKSGITWHTIAGGRVDPATAGGALLATITGAVAQYESQVKSERVQASVQRRLAEGQDLGGARPFGYATDRVTLRENEAALVREAYRMMLEDGNVYRVAKMLNASGLKTTRGGEWTTTTVRAMLQRHRYAGVLAHKGEKVSETLTAIVSAEDWDAVNTILSDPTRKTAPGAKSDGHLLSGIARCSACGATLKHDQVSSTVKGRKYVYATYRCNKKMSDRHSGVRHVSMSAERMDDLVLAGVLDYLGEGAVDAPSGDQSDLRVLNIKLADLSEKLESAYGLLLDSSLKGQDRIKARIRELELEQTTVTADRDALLGASALGSAFDDFREYMENVGRKEGTDWPYLVQRNAAYEAWDALGLDRQRTILKGSFKVTLHPKEVAERVSVEPI